MAYAVLDVRSAAVRLTLIVAALLTVAFLIGNLSKSYSPASLTSYTTRIVRGQDGGLEDVFNQTLGFQRIFVINLPTRPDHRDAMSLAAALTPGGLIFEYVDGVANISQKALPPGANERTWKPGAIPAWRAHIDVIRTIVEQNITSAFIMEDDIDWDVRIKSQMYDLARASRLLLQPGQEDETFDLQHTPVEQTISSPYGDVQRWDVLWPGHCGAEFPEPDSGIHQGRVIMFNDSTVPEPQHWDKEWGSADLVRLYAEHTRVVHRARMNVCSLAYAVSQNGARRILYELGITRLQAEFDIMLREMCDGTAGRSRHNCLTIQPQLFDHHRPIGSQNSFSEVENLGGGKNEVAYTRNIRWSTRLNLRKLLDGETDYLDQWQDGAPRNHASFP